MSGTNEEWEQHDRAMDKITTLCMELDTVEKIRAEVIALTMLKVAAWIAASLEAPLDSAQDRFAEEYNLAARDRARMTKGGSA